MAAMLKIRSFTLCCMQVPFGPVSKAIFSLRPSRNLPIAVKAVLLVVCVGITTHYIVYFIRHHRRTIHHNKPRVRLGQRMVNPLPSNIAKYAYKEYIARGDQRDDNVKIIQWFPAPNFVTSDGFLHQVICEKVRCAVATKGTFLRSSHAIIFPDAYVRKNQIPFKKSADIVWILFNKRPFMSKDIKDMKSVLKDRSVFNWTVSFRHDADIQISYGKIINRTAVPLYDMATILSRKQTTVVAILENCKSSSRAEEYIRRLKRYVKVDVWNSCENKTLCDATGDTRCFTKMGRSYKFFLAFEDMLCQDYITDRFFRYYGTDAVAIVRGGADYTKVVPAGTYINTADFSSIDKLGKYINYLDNNDKAYTEILKCKRSYESQYSHYAVRNGKKLIGFKYLNMENMMCDICHRLWSKNRYTKYYGDVVGWYEHFECSNPRDLK